jgi:hypothetical protein
MSPRICNLYYTLHAAQIGHDTPSHTVNNVEPLSVWGRHPHRLAEIVSPSYMALQASTHCGRIFQNRSWRKQG